MATEADIIPFPAGPPARTCASGPGVLLASRVRQVGEPPVRAGRGTTLAAAGRGVSNGGPLPANRTTPFPGR